MDSGDYSIEDAFCDLEQGNPFDQVGAVAFLGARGSREDLDSVERILAHRKPRSELSRQLEVARLQAASGVKGVVEALNMERSRVRAQSLRIAVYNSDLANPVVRAVVRDDLFADDLERLYLAFASIATRFPADDLDSQMFERLLTLALSAEDALTRFAAVDVLDDVMEAGQIDRAQRILIEVGRGAHRSPWWRFRRDEDAQVAKGLLAIAERSAPDVRKP